MKSFIESISSSSVTDSSSSCSDSISSKFDSSQSSDALSLIESLFLILASNFFWFFIKFMQAWVSTTQKDSVETDTERPSNDATAWVSNTSCNVPSLLRILVKTCCVSLTSVPVSSAMLGRILASSFIDCETTSIDSPSGVLFLST